MNNFILYSVFLFIGFYAFSFLFFLGEAMLFGFTNSNNNQEDEIIVYYP